MNIIIRFTTEKDIPQVLRIENDNFAEPWTKEMFNIMLRKEFLQDVEESHNFYVCENNSKIIGYIIWGTEEKFPIILSMILKLKYRIYHLGK
ncbi:hypothetical protein ES703_117674 [subsurface metagenome]